MCDILQNNELLYSEISIFCTTVSCDILTFCKTGISYFFIFFRRVRRDIFIIWYFDILQLWYSDILIFCKTISCDTLMILHFAKQWVMKFWYSKQIFKTVNVVILRYFAKQWAMIIWHFYILQNIESWYFDILQNKSVDTLIFLHFAK